jgi:hypothetical protein
MRPDPFLVRNVAVPEQRARTLLASGQLNPGNVGGWSGASVGGWSGSGKKKYLNVRVPVQVRFDVTFLRQDFSVQLPGTGLGEHARFDYVVRTQVLSPQKAAQMRSQAKLHESYPQRDAVLFALRALTGQDAGSTTLAWQQLYPDAAIDVEADSLFRKLLQAGPLHRPLLLKNYRDGKGEAFTKALLSAVSRLTGPSREEACAALAYRLAELGASPLRGYLHAGKPGMRQAAVLACERKKDMALVPDLIARLGDADASTARLARSALKAITGQDLSTVQDWQQWWSQGRRVVRQ